MMPFAKSVLFGALAGSAPYTVLSTFFALILMPRVFIDGDGWSALASVTLAILPLVIAIPIVFTASVVIGLPVAAALKHLNVESGGAYVGLGAATGAILPAVALLLISPINSYWFISLLGTLSGAVTGYTWWRSARMSSGTICL